MLAVTLAANACQRPAPTPPDGSAAALRAELTGASAAAPSTSHTRIVRDSATQARIDSASAARETAYRAAWGAVDTSHVWFEMAGRLDLTGDGAEDVLILRARGPVPESLFIHLLAVVGTDTLTVEGWQSDYELVDPPFPRDTTPEVVASYLRANLEKTLGGLEVESRTVEAKEFDWYDTDCTTDPIPCLRSDLGRDSALAERVWKDFQAGPRTVIHYSFGYESTITRAWSPVARRFIYVWGCC